MMRHESEMSSEGGRLEGRYANYFTIGHNAFEFLLQFGQFFQDGEIPSFHTRIVTSPSYAKSLLETLQQAVDRYEETFGVIRDENRQGGL
jgi:hypothetical protein